MFLSFEAPWSLLNHELFQVLLGPESSWQRTEKDLQAAETARASPSHLTTFIAP